MLQWLHIRYDGKLTYFILQNVLDSLSHPIFLLLFTSVINPCGTFMRTWEKACKLCVSLSRLHSIIIIYYSITSKSQESILYFSDSTSICGAFSKALSSSSSMSPSWFSSEPKLIGINHFPHLWDPLTNFMQDSLVTGVTGNQKEQFCEVRKFLSP